MRKTYKILVRKLIGRRLGGDLRLRMEDSSTSGSYSPFLML